MPSELGIPPKRLRFIGPYNRRHQKMLYLDLTLEDTRMIAENSSTAQAGPWEVRLIDGPTGTEDCREMSDQELVSILVLAIANDEHALASFCYPIAEQALKGLNPILRPIP
jgi:hypothetical protein